MCGIVGVLGSHEAAPILVDALKRLEYRGYDSAGIATAHNGALSRRRAVGKLAELSDVLVHDPLVGKDRYKNLVLRYQVFPKPKNLVLMYQVFPKLNNLVLRYQVFSLVPSFSKP